MTTNANKCDDQSSFFVLISPLGRSDLSLLELDLTVTVIKNTVVKVGWFFGVELSPGETGTTRHSTEIY